MQGTIESRSGELMSIPLSRLVPSKHNARRIGGTNVDDLKASIRVQGVLQNLVVCPAQDHKGKATGDYEVVGGRRRLRALLALAKEGDIRTDEEIVCRVKPTREAAEASLAENVAREAMHPADEFEAFKRLVDEGRSVEDVAARFGTSPLTVRRRLKLAALHPKLIELYRQDGIALEQLMALTVTDDAEEQLRVWNAAPEWCREPGSLRRALVSDEIDAARDPLVKLVGLDAYEAAGGAVRRDLFDDEGGGYVQDGALLARLADEKLQAAAEVVRDEGWSWVEVVPRIGASDLFRFDRCRKTRRKMTKAEAKRHAALVKAVEDLDGRLEQHYESDEPDGPTDDAIRALERKAEEAREQLDNFERALEAYADDALAVGGAILSVGREGNIEVHRGLLRPQDRKRSAATAEERQAGDDEVSKETAPARPQHSAALMMELSAHRTLAARAVMIDQPRSALVALLHGLVQRLLYQGYAPASTAVRLVPNLTDQGLGTRNETLRSSKAAQAVADAQARWDDRLPGDQGRLLPWLISQSDADLHELLALCVALTLNDVHDSERAGPLDALAGVLSLDMGDWWEATAEGYFSRVTKETILAAIEEGAGAEAAQRIKGVSKAELARVAERELSGKRWLPPPLRTAPEAA